MITTTGCEYIHKIDLIQDREDIPILNKMENKCNIKDFLKKEGFTIVDIFDRKFCKQHKAWVAVSDYLLDDLVSLVIQYLNPKPGNNIPFPTKRPIRLQGTFIYNGMQFKNENQNELELLKDGCFTKNRYCYPPDGIQYLFFVWCDISTFDIGICLFTMKLTPEIVGKNNYEVIGILNRDGVIYPDEYCFGSIVTEFTPETLRAQVNADMHVHVSATKILPSQENGTYQIYLDPEGKQVCYLPNGIYPGLLKNIYVKLPMWLTSEPSPDCIQEHFNIYPPIFAHLHKIGRPIQDLNYAISIILHRSDTIPGTENKCVDVWKDDVINLDNVNIEIKFSDQKQRNLTNKEFENNVLLVQFNTNLNEYVNNTIILYGKEKPYPTHYFMHKGTLTNKEHIFWSGIHFYSSTVFVPWDYCSFDARERIFSIEGVR